MQTFAAPWTPALDPLLGAPRLLCDRAPRRGFVFTKGRAAPWTPCSIGAPRLLALRSSAAAVLRPTEPLGLRIVWIAPSLLHPDPVGLRLSLRILWIAPPPPLAEPVGLRLSLRIFWIAPSLLLPEPVGLAALLRRWHRRCSEHSMDQVSEPECGQTTKRFEPRIL